MWKSMKVIEETVMIPMRRVNIRSTHRQNRVIIVVNEIVAVHRQVESIKNRHIDGAARAAAAIVVAIHVIRIVHESIRHDENAHRPMIAQANQAKAATNVINIQEKKVTPEVTATNEVVTE